MFLGEGCKQIRKGDTVVGESPLKDGSCMVVRTRKESGEATGRDVHL